MPSAHSVALARRARDRYAAEAGPAATDLLVAGSVGPYGAMLADGSEYRGDYDPGETALREVHAPRIEALLDAGVDLLAFETIPTIREAEVLVDLLDEFDARAWLSYSCRDGSSTSAGEPIETAIALGEAPGIVAVGINCTAPRFLPALLDAAHDATTRPLHRLPERRAIGGMRRPGGGWRTTAARSIRPSSPGGRRVGATWLGGCCGTGPADIARLVARTRTWGGAEHGIDGAPQHHDPRSDVVER